MYNYHNKKKFIWSIFLILLLAIGIGYAYLTSNLSIVGNTQVTTNTWNIHFENLNVTTGSVTATTPASIQSNNTSITYTINLNRPKDFYEFTVDVKNDGTLPGKVSISSLSGLDSTSSKIIDYTIKYINGNSVNVGDILNPRLKKTIRVRVFYKDEIDPEDFPDDDLNLTLTYTLQYIQSEEEELVAGNILQNLSKSNSCIDKYEGEVTDQLGQTVNASNVYFDKCEDKRNIIFGGYCWQIVRATETSGLKMIYNGEPENEKCYARSEHKGVVQTNDVSKIVGFNDLYGDSFTYTNNMFTIKNTNVEKGIVNNSENIIGKYTCRNTTGTCNTLYYANKYYPSSYVSYSVYEIKYTNYAQIGENRYNTDSNSPAMVGYMFNKVYAHSSKSSISIDGAYKFGSSFTYNTGTNTYTLSGTTQSISDWSTGYNQINNTHYTCWNSDGNCETLFYIYRSYYSGSGDGANYILLTDGKGIGDAIAEMLSASDVNSSNSLIKSQIDIWYENNMMDYNEKLENTVFCNNREILELNGWDPAGGDATSTSGIVFSNVKLKCPNETDQFSIGNNKANLKYPVALLSEHEIHNISEGSLLNTSSSWYSMSPSAFEQGGVARVRAINTVGNEALDYVSLINGVRPVVSLAPDNKIIGGTGSESDPWILE